jgi:hypothetical protein
METSVKLALIEAVQPEIAPFEDQVHTLMIESVGKIASGWIEQIKIIHDNLAALEAQILACVTDAKHKITTLHDLGQKVADEAKRSQEVVKQLSDSIENIA